MISWRKWLILIVGFAAFGLVRLPIEHGLHRDMQKAGLWQETVRLSFRDQLGQNAFLAALGGFRSLVATILDLTIFEEWQKNNYGKVEAYCRLTQALQPKVFYYYDRGQDMMATNAALYYQKEDEELAPSLASARYDLYVKKGIEMCRNGIENIPNQWRIHQALAIIYRERVKPRQPIEESKAWLAASRCPNALLYCRRFGIYALCYVEGCELEAERLIEQLWNEDPVNRSFGTVRSHRETFKAVRLAAIPGREMEALTKLRQLYAAMKSGHTPLIIRTIQRLEDELGVPFSEKIPDPSLPLLPSPVVEFVECPPLPL